LWREALDAFVAGLRLEYGARLEDLVLYGSRARGDAGDDADIDTLVVLNPLGDFWEELSRIAPLASRVSLEFGVVISAIPIDAAELRHPRTPLAINAAREGVLIK
jgi:predicted nucleotidyltransferase